MPTSSPFLKTGCLNKKKVHFRRRKKCKSKGKIMTEKAAEEYERGRGIDHEKQVKIIKLRGKYCL